MKDVEIICIINRFTLLWIINFLYSSLSLSLSLSLFPTCIDICHCYLTLVSDTGIWQWYLKIESDNGDWQLVTDTGYRHVWLFICTLLCFCVLFKQTLKTSTLLCFEEHANTLWDYFFFVTIKLELLIIKMMMIWCGKSKNRQYLTRHGGRLDKLSFTASSGSGQTQSKPSLLVWRLDAFVQTSTSWW